MPDLLCFRGGDRVQAEGFSSSVAPSLESRDIDALYRVRTPGRALSVTMKNEAIETHVIRRVRLLAARRPENGRVIRSTAGNFFAVTDVRPATSSRADEGDCLERVRAFYGHERFHAADEQAPRVARLLISRWPPARDRAASCSRRVNRWRGVRAL